MPNILKTLLALITVLMSALIATSCGGSSQTDTSRGIPVSQNMLDGIASGLSVSGSGSLRDGWAVKSSDFKNMYFIAAEIDGPGMEGDGEIGLWASNSLEPGQGLIFAVDYMAKDFSVWPHGDTTDAEITEFDDGADESKSCVSESQSKANGIVHDGSTDKVTILELFISPTRLSVGDRLAISVMASNDSDDSSDYKVVYKIDGKIEEIVDVPLSSHETKKIELAFNTDIFAPGIHYVDVNGLTDSFTID